MATFKVGGRAELVSVPHGAPAFLVAMIGERVTVLAVGASEIVVAWDSTPPGWEKFKVCATEPSHHFKPLDGDSSADAFIERIRGMKPYEEPVVEKTYSQHFADVWRELTGR